MSLYLWALVLGPICGVFGGVVGYCLGARLERWFWRHGL